MDERAARAQALGGMPVGKRTPRGTKRWYLIHAPGREEATCEKVRRLVSPELLDDAFVMRKERVWKHGGKRVVSTEPMYRDYFFVVTRDVGALDKELSKLSFPARIAMGEGSHFAPMASEAQAWYERMMDGTHTIRMSTAVIEGGVLHVEKGPMVGQEARVAKIDRHRNVCDVRVCEGGSAFLERVPFTVPIKS